MEYSNEKIFLTGNNIFTLSLTEQRLRNLGYFNLAIVNTGVECLNLLSEKPSVIFLDYRMNDADGIELLKKIKQTDKAIYVVLMVSVGDINAAVNSLRNGAFDYIVKGENELERMEKILDKIKSINTIWQGYHFKTPLSIIENMEYRAHSDN